MRPTRLDDAPPQDLAPFHGRQDHATSLPRAPLGQAPDGWRVLAVEAAYETFISAVVLRAPQHAHGLWLNPPPALYVTVLRQRCPRPPHPEPAIPDDARFAPLIG
jgi:hypothetical protein